MVFRSYWIVFHQVDNYMFIRSPRTVWKVTFIQGRGFSIQFAKVPEGYKFSLKLLIYCLLNTGRTVIKLLVSIIE